jgi:uncharacterized protein
MPPVRQPLPDLVRAFALFGIAVVNVDYFAHPSGDGLLQRGLGSPLDRALWWVVATVFLLKSYSLFAMMFGYGFGRQMRAAESQGARFPGRHARRMLGLLLLGLLNAAFLFFGDILVVYAVLGTVLYLFRSEEPRALRRWAFGLYALQIVIVLLLLSATLALSVPDNAATLREMLAETARASAEREAGFAAGGFFAVADTRFGAWAEDFGYMLAMQGPGAMAFILYGLYAARAGLFDDLEAARWSRARRVYLPVGLLLAGLGGWLMAGSAHESDPAFMAGFSLIMIGSPLSSVGYLGWLAAWLRGGPSPVRDLLGRAGSASLTAYLLQGLLMSWVFAGYGLGWVGKLGASAYLPVGVIAALASLWFVARWRGRYALGPVEAVLRRWVYLGQPPCK